MWQPPSPCFFVLDSHIGAIYVDSITYQRMMEIFERFPNTA